MGLFLTLICVLSGFALAFTHDIAEPRIAAHRAEAERAAVATVLSSAESVSAVDLGEEMPDMRGDVRGVFRGVPAGVAFKVAQPGYSGDIVLMVGVSAGEITGVEVLEQTETPGLGARIVEDAFLQRYVGLPAEPGATRQEADGLAGATISAKAVTEAVELALEAYAHVGEER